MSEPMQQEISPHVNGGEHFSPVDWSAVHDEIVWNKRYFRQDIWRTDLAGGRDFKFWDDFTKADPADDIESAAGLIEAQGELLLMAGMFVVEALIANPKLQRRADLVGGMSAQVAAQLLGVDRIVTLNTVFNPGWSDKLETTCAPSQALLIRASLKDGVEGIVAAERGSSYRMLHPDQGVLFMRCVRR